MWSLLTCHWLWPITIINTDNSLSSISVSPFSCAVYANDRPSIRATERLRHVEVVAVDGWVGWCLDASISEGSKLQLYYNCRYMAKLHG